MSHLHKPSCRSGKITMLLLFLIAVVVALAGLFLLLSQAGRDRVACEEHLRTIYRATQLYEVDRGVLPSLAYYPSDPQGDADSLSVALESYGVEPAICVCPGTHYTLRELGLTYVWNATLNAKRTPQGAPPVWMLIEMTAVNPALPKPHIGHYNVLYSDGTIKRIKNPKELPGL